MLRRAGEVLADLRLVAGIVAGGLVRGETRSNLTDAACAEEHGDERPVRDWLATYGWRGAAELVGIVSLACGQAVVDALRVPFTRRPAGASRTHPAADRRRP